MPLTLYPSQQPYVATNIAVPYKGAETTGGPDMHSQTSSNDGSSGSEQRRGYIFFFSFPLPIHLIKYSRLPHSTHKEINKR